MKTATMEKVEHDIRVYDSCQDQILINKSCGAVQTMDVKNDRQFEAVGGVAWTSDGQC